MRDTDSEHVWSKPGPRFRLPRAPRVSLKTLLIVAPLLAATAFAMVGFVAAPAGSPKSPPPPAVAAEPLSSLISAPTETPTPTDTPSPEATVAVPPDPPPPHCKPKAHPLSASPAKGSLIFTDVSTSARLVIFDPQSKKRSVVLDGGQGCGFLQPRFIDDHTVQFVKSSEYPAEFGGASLDVRTGTLRMLSRDPQKWDWIAYTAMSPDGSKLAVLGEIGGEQPFLLRVTSTPSGHVLYTKRLGHICYCDGGWIPAELKWSADNDILLVSVPLPPDDAFGIYSFNAAGKPVRTLIKGSYPRWIGSARAFIYQDRTGNWWRVDGLYAAPKPFIVTNRSLQGPVFSPDLSKIAFWDLNDLSLVVFDTATKKLTTIATNRISPVWLDGDTVLSTGVKTCNCEGFDFTYVSWSTSVTTGRSTRIGSFAWGDADVLR